MAKLYSLCPLCAGTGRFTAVSNRDPVPRERACIYCKPLRVIESGLSEAQAERLVRDNEAMRETLNHLADGCRNRCAKYGLPVPRSCPKCGPGGECVFNEEGA